MPAIIWFVAGVASAVALLIALYFANSWQRPTAHPHQALRALMRNTQRKLGGTPGGILARRTQPHVLGHFSRRSLSAHH